jgi:uncharacterized protein involved in response to NO
MPAPPASAAKLPVLAAPHRILFLGGALQALAAFAWWVVDLADRYGGWLDAPAWSLPGPWSHAWLLIYGLFPFFIFGFLLTAVPNWLGVPPRRAGYIASAVLLVLGIATFYVGLASNAAIAASGAVLHLCGWSIALFELARILVISPPSDKRYPRLIVTELAFGWLGNALFLAWLATGEPFLAELSRKVGLWLFLLPLFFTVSHRMVPFFSSRVIENYTPERPRWVLRTVIAGAALHGALELLGAHRWLWVVDLPLFATVLYATLKWGLLQCFKARLLAVLHLSLAGLAGAMLLYSAQSLALAAGNVAIFGTAPMHVMTLCYFSAMLIGMVSRVSLGHSGRPLSADTLTWVCFWGMFATAGVRVLAELDTVPAGLRVQLMPIAAALWLVFFGAWAWRYVPMYLRSRTDGMPG